MGRWMLRRLLRGDLRGFSHECGWVEEQSCVDSGILLKLEHYSHWSTFVLNIREV